MFTFIEVVIVLVIIAIISIIKLMFLLDCDLTLKYYELFGSSLTCLSGKVIWISGGSSGIGEQLAYVFAKAGTKLVLSADEELSRVKENCISLGSSPNDIYTIPPFDIKDYSKHQKLVEEVINHFEKIDILINNVGRTQRSYFEDISLDIDKELFSINVFGPINLSRLVLKHFIETKSGQFVVTTSVAAKFGAPFSATYTAAKHALHGYFECVRSECADFLSVTMVCPGPVNTSLIDRALKSETFKYSVKCDGKQNLIDNKMTPSRCAYLMSIAIANKLDEVWISKQPILWLLYASQYFPTIFRYFLVRLVSKERAMNMRAQ